MEYASIAPGRARTPIRVPDGVAGDGPERVRGALACPQYADAA